MRDSQPPRRFSPAAPRRGDAERECRGGERRCWLDALTVCRDCLGDVDPCDGFHALRLDRALDAMIDADRRLAPSIEERRP